MVAGTSGNNMAAWRFTVAGAPDGTFAAGAGFVTAAAAAGAPAFQNTAEAAATAVDARSNTVVAGLRYDAAGTSHGAVWRYTPSGALDVAFAESGMRSLDATTARSLTAMALDGSGRIVAVGSSRQRGVVVRLDVTGALDLSFGASGVVDLPPAPDGDETANPTSVAIDAKGRVVVGGASQLGYWTTSASGPRSRMAAWRLTAPGALDATFGAGGLFVHTPPGPPSKTALADIANGVAVDAVDRPVLVGQTSLSGDAPGMAVWRLNP